jgi:hypothetical protein
MLFHILKNLPWLKAANFLCVRSNLLESVTVTVLLATESYWSLDLAKAKYSISRRSEVEKENVIVRISHSSFSACEIRKST